MRRSCTPRFAWTASEGGLRAFRGARIYTRVDGLRDKADSKRRDFEGGSGGMQAKRSARMLGPASVQGSRKRRWLRTPSIGVSARCQIGILMSMDA
jgi:hypothetical protein